MTHDDVTADGVPDQRRSPDATTARSGASRVIRRGIT